MNPIDALFHSRRAAVRKVFVPFVPAGDPDLDTTARLLPALAAAGAGLVEVGFPFSDPIADGPVITGERDRLPPELLDQLRWLRTQTTLPLCVGFGVSRPEQVAMLRDAADGVIVGSALVRLLGQIGDRLADDVFREIQALVRE